MCPLRRPGRGLLLRAAKVRSFTFTRPCPGLHERVGALLYALELVGRARDGLRPREVGMERHAHLQLLAGRQRGDLRGCRGARRADAGAGRSGRARSRSRPTVAHTSQRMLRAGKRTGRIPIEESQNRLDSPSLPRLHTTCGAHDVAPVLRGTGRGVAADRACAPRRRGFTWPSRTPNALGSLEATHAEALRGLHRARKAEVSELLTECRLPHEAAPVSERAGPPRPSAARRCRR